MTVNLNAVQNPQFSPHGESPPIAAEQQTADFSECVKQAVLNGSGQKSQAMVNTKASGKASAAILEGLLKKHGDSFKFQDENGTEMTLFLQFAIYMMNNPLPQDMPRISLSEDNELAQEFMAMMLNPETTIEQLIACHRKMAASVLEEHGVNEDISVYGLLDSDSNEKSQQNINIENAHFLNHKSRKGSEAYSTETPKAQNNAQANPEAVNPQGLKANADYFSEFKQLIYGKADTGEVPTTAQIEQALSELAKQTGGKPIKVVAETSQEQTQSTSEQNLFETVKVDIKAKPEEFSQLQQFKAQAETTEKAQNAEKQTAVPEKSENTEKQTATESQMPAFTPKAPKIEIAAKQVQLSEVNIRSITEEIIARITTTVKRETTFEMTLNPAKLGKITIKLVMEESGMLVKITAEKASTAQLLQNSSDRITQTLERNDSRFESFTVTVEQKPDYPEQQNQRGQNGRQDYEPEEAEDDEQIEISFAELIQSM